MTPDMNKEKAVSFKLFEDGGADNIPNISEEIKQKVKQFLQVVEIYKQEKSR
jgi:hypothetical protein